MGSAKGRVVAAPRLRIEASPPAIPNRTVSSRSYEGLPELEYPAHDWTAVITACGRISHDRRKINVSQVFAARKWA
jgi:hypothetical protein